MRFGTSGLGVIAVVSLLAATVAPERDDNADTERESRIDHSSARGTWRISSKGYSWPSQVTTETGSSFVKIEFERLGSTSPEASRSPSIPRSSLVRRVHRGSTETATASLLRYTSSRAFAEARNFASGVNPPDARSATDQSFQTTFENNEIHAVDPTLVYSSKSKEFLDKFVVALDSPLLTVESSIRHFSEQSPTPTERKTFLKPERTESDNKYDDKRSTEESRNRRVRSSGAKSAGTMNHQLTTTTTTTTTRRRLTDENFRNPTEHRQVEMIRDTRESTMNEANNEKAHSGNGETEVNEIPRTTTGIMSENTGDDLNLDSRYLPNYAASPIANSTVKDENDRSTTVESSNNLMDKSLRKMTNRREESVVHDEAQLDHRQLTVRSMDEASSRKRETVVYSSVTEEISLSRQMTPGPQLDPPMIVRPYSRLSGNLANANFTVDSMSHKATSFDNHKAFKVRTFQSTISEQQEQQQHQQRAASLESLSFPTRLHEAIGENKTTERRPVISVNQLAVPKFTYPVSKNHSKPSINLVDGKANKIFYEIKPSLFTETDRGASVEVTTTPRRVFEKFLIPSVPSPIGKFQPYFLDVEDQRNVTERIGNTVQLNCRIGMLGHRQVTWLQHYKDSFRLLTVGSESYSVDRRISLHFRYPDNWRLQIAYASVRDSGLYQCQVEIDQGKSLVKTYNVIITAPVLTITDDSGRPVSGERHLKAGSALKLRCEARDILQRLNESVLWMRGDETLAEDVSENKTTEVVNEKEITVVISTLLVERATPRHAGNYSCVVPDKARNTIAVHVLNAAVECFGVSPQFPVYQNGSSYIVDIGSEKQLPAGSALTSSSRGKSGTAKKEKLRDHVALVGILKLISHSLGELPAAVQHGSGVSTAVLNLWLIHLSASYGFFR